MSSHASITPSEAAQLFQSGLVGRLADAAEKYDVPYMRGKAFDIASIAACKKPLFWQQRYKGFGFSVSGPYAPPSLFALSLLVQKYFVEAGYELPLDLQRLAAAAREKIELRSIVNAAYLVSARRTTLETARASLARCINWQMAHG